MAGVFASDLGVLIVDFALGVDLLADLGVFAADFGVLTVDTGVLATDFGVFAEDFGVFTADFGVLAGVSVFAEVFALLGAGVFKRLDTPS